MARERMNYMPVLQNLLDGCYDPKGCYVDEIIKSKDDDGKTVEVKTGQLVFAPWSKDNQPGGEISLNENARAAFDNLCKTVGYKADDLIETGGGGAMVKVKDLAAAMAKAGKETQALVDVQVE
jgi:hypothetical protein